MLGRTRARPSLHREERLVFVVGSPRSGTTFLGNSLGAQPGLVDLGEVKPLKAAIPELAQLPEEEAAARFRRTLDVVRRSVSRAHLRGVEQTPETSFVLAAALRAYPAAQAVHIVRDGRDVVCSLLERGWLGAERAGSDDAGRRLRRASALLGRAGPGRGVQRRRAKRAEPRGRGAATSPLRAPSPERTLEIRYEAAGQRAGSGRNAGRVPRPDRTLRSLSKAFDRSVGRQKRPRRPAGRSRSRSRRLLKTRLPQITYRRQCGLAALTHSYADVEAEARARSAPARASRAQVLKTARGGQSPQSKSRDSRPQRLSSRSAGRDARAFSTVAVSSPGHGPAATTAGSPVHRLLEPRLLLGLEERVVLEGVLGLVDVQGHLRVERGVLLLQLEMLLDRLREQRRAFDRHDFSSWGASFEAPSLAPSAERLCAKLTSRLPSGFSKNGRMARLRRPGTIGLALTASTSGVGCRLRSGGS